jgi:hypothetical protein
MTIHTTLKARAQTLTSLVGCALGRLHCWAECWLLVLMWWWLYILLVHLLRWLLRLSVGSRHPKLGLLHLELGALHLHWHLWPIHLLCWFEELVRLWEARPNIASRGLSMEWHLPLAILIHLLDLVFNNNGLVDHVLEVYIVHVEQLELNIIIQSIQEHALFLLISVDVVRGIS